MDASDHLVKKIATERDELIAALSSPDFYIELMLIGIALALAWLMALLIRRQVKNQLTLYPPRLIDAEFILKPLSLLGPTLALLYLSVVKPFAEEYAGSGGNWTGAVVQLCFAFILAKCVMLLVRTRPVAYFIAFVIMAVVALDVTGFMDSTTAFLKSMEWSFGNFKLNMLNLVQGIIILVVVFWIAGMLSHTLESYLRRSSSLSYNGRELLVKFFRLFIYFAALLITLSAIGVDLTAFAVFGGALGVGIGLGLQKLTANFVSGMTMLMEKSVQIGDLIEVGNVSGTIRQLNLRYVLIETADGREILVPNDEMLSTRVTNWTHSNNKARVDIRVHVGYDSDPALVRDMLLQAASEHPRCLKDPTPSSWLREFGDNALIFQLSFWIPDVHEGRFGPQSEVMMAVLKKFRNNGIRIPNPAATNKAENIPVTTQG